MEWSRSNSIILSRVCIGLFAAAGIVCAVGAPFAISGIVSRRGMEIQIGSVYFMASFYSLLLPAFAALICLYTLLSNISKGEIFIAGNIKCLRWISWACYLAAGISCLSVFYYRPFIILAAGAGFMGLILRVVKNVFAEAVYMKQEQDYTI